MQTVRTKTPKQVEPLVSEPLWLYAGWSTTDNGDRLLWVYRSPIVRDDDPIYRPVRSFLDRVEYDTLAKDTIDDDRWTFGGYELTVYRILGER